MRKLLLLLMLLFPVSAHAAVTTYDNIFVTNDVYSSDFPERLNENFDRSLNGGINSISTANIVDDTLLEADMADEINPRIRTYEGAACEFVYSGLEPATSASLSTTISAGTAYPRGYRINKASSTAKTFTASKHTYVDIDINGDFQYNAVAIDAAVPSVASNSIRLARVSTDGTTVNAVQDLRTTNCTSGPFEDIADATGEATLDDILANGRIRTSADAGWIQGAQISWDALTVFKVRAGSVYINGEFRSVSQDISVPQTADAPSTGVSGIDTGAIGSSTKYYVYAVADEDSTKDFSVSFSTNNTTPTGITNKRKIGTIKTNASSQWSKQDILTYHMPSKKNHLVAGWVNFNGTGTVAINDSFNVSGLTDNSDGNYTITWDNDFDIVNYPVTFGMGTDGQRNVKIVSTAIGSVNFITHVATDGSVSDQAIINLIAMGASNEDA